HVVQAWDAAAGAPGGSAIMSTHDVLTWPGTPDGTYTDCYKANRSNVARVVDLTDPDESGVWPDYAKYVDPAALQAAGAVNGWAQDGSSLYVRRADGEPVTNDNTRAFVVATNHYASGLNVNGFYQGVEWHGGSQGSFYNDGGGSIVT